MHKAVARREDSVQVSLESLRALEQQRIEDERHALEQEQIAEVRRLAAQSQLAEQQRREQERAREEALREERIRIEAERARIVAEERRLEAERAAALEHKRIELEMRRAELEASTLGLTDRGWSKRRVTVLFCAVMAVQALVMYRSHHHQRAGASRVAALTRQVQTLERDNQQLRARGNVPTTEPTAPASPVAVDKPARANTDRRAGTSRGKPVRARPPRQRPRADKPAPRSGSNAPVHLDCDPREPLCGAR